MTTLGTVQYLNTFSQGDVRGREDAKLNFNKIPVKILAEKDEVVSAGDMVKLVPGGKTISTVSQIKSTEEYSNKNTYGFIPLARLKNTYLNKDIATMCLSGCVMEMIAEQPISCGEQVYYDARATATAGVMIFNNLDYSDFTSISAGTLTVQVDGVDEALSALDFSGETSLAEVAGVLNTALTGKATVVAVDETTMMIKSDTTGADSSIDIEADAGATYSALNVLEATKVDGEPAGVNLGKVLPYQGANEAGIVLCGVAMNDAEENQLVRIQIK